MSRSFRVHPDVHRLPAGFGRTPHPRSLSSSEARPMQVRLRSRVARPSADAPLRAQFLSIEGLEERARGLAAGHTLSSSTRRGVYDLGARLHQNATVLRHAYRLIAAVAR